MSYNLINADSLKWLQDIDDYYINNIVSGIPDLDETSFKSLNEYDKWFSNIVKLLFAKTNPYGYIILCQTDRKINGCWYDKSSVIHMIANEMNWKLMWHKIVLNRPVGSANLHRPTYSHLVCFSKYGRPGNGLPDVIEYGERWYSNATPTNVAKIAMKFLGNKIADSNKFNKKSYDIIDPFVGHGTIPYYAIINNMTVLGIDIDQNQLDITNKNLKHLRL